MLAGSILGAIARLTRAPREILGRAFFIGLLFGAINLLVDVISIFGGFWHYNLPGLFWGFPLDLYFSGALVYGAGVLLLYRWLRQHYPDWVMPFLIFLPLWGLSRDALGSWATGSIFITWDHPLWWAVDLLGWAAMFYIPLYLFSKSTPWLPAQTNPPKP